MGYHMDQALKLTSQGNCIYLISDTILLTFYG